MMVKYLKLHHNILPVIEYVKQKQKLQAIDKTYIQHLI